VLGCAEDPPLELNILLLLLLLSLVLSLFSITAAHGPVQELGAAEVLKEQACYLPCSDDGLPVIGKVPGLDNAYVATGTASDKQL
jgi:hypothetical protein